MEEGGRGGAGGGGGETEAMVQIGRERERLGVQDNTWKVVVAYVRSRSTDIGKRQKYWWAGWKCTRSVKPTIAIGMMMSEDWRTSMTAMLLHRHVYGLRMVRWSF